MADVVFTFSYETWDDAVRRGMMRPPDRIAATLMACEDVPRLIVANPFRSLPSLAARAILRRDRPFPGDARQHLVRPWTWRRGEGSPALGEVEARYRAYGRALGREVRRHGLDDPVLLTTHPLVAGFSAPDWAASVVYFARDDWLSYPGRGAWWPAYREAYRRIARDRVAVAAVSQQIVDRIAPEGPSRVIPNGVDPAEWTDERGPEPPALREIPHPRAIYVGTLDDRLDAEGLAHLARRRPGVQLVLVGPVVDGTLLEPLLDLGNVHILPPVGRRDLVRLLRHADVCLVAHRRTPLTEAMSPLKAYEYLAAGCPVLSVDLPPMRGLGDRVRLVDDVAGFADVIDEVVALGPAPEAARMELLGANSWAARHRQLLELVLPSRIVSDA